MSSKRILHKIENGVETKRCGSCEVYRPLDNFNNCAKSWDKLRPTCKLCLAEQRAANKETMTEYNKAYWQKTKEEQTEKHKIWVSENKEHIKQKNREWVEKNAEYKKQKDKEYRKTHIEQYRANHNAWVKKDYDDMKTNPERSAEYIEYRLKTNTSRRIRGLLTGGKEDSTTKYLGCTKEQLKRHLENQFSEGMTWANYGENDETASWHIDHIIPCAAFDLTNILQQIACFNYRNLQPMWAKENMSKKDSYKEEDKQAYLKRFFEECANSNTPNVDDTTISHV
jgi:hypothetical protein